MITKTRLGMALATCAMLAACSSPAPAPAPTPAVEPQPPPAPPPAPAASFDGTYTGTVVQVRAAGGWPLCSGTRHVTIHIANGAFTYAPTARRLVIHATVMPGGAFEGTLGDTTIKGQIADGRLTGTSDGTRCGYTFDLTQR